MSLLSFLFFFFFNDTATTEIYTLSLHDALPIFGSHGGLRQSSNAFSRKRHHHRPLGDGRSVARASLSRLQERVPARVDRRVRETDRQKDHRQQAGVGNGNHPGTG